MNLQPNLVKAIGLSLLTSLVASLVAAGTKYSSGFLSLHVIICVQYGVGLALSAPLLIRRGGHAFTTRRPGLHLVRGLAGLGGFYAYYWAITRIPLVEATLLRTAAPLCVPLVVWVWLGIHIPRSRWLPLGVGFLGVLFILRPVPGAFSIWHLVGFGSAVLLATSMVATRRLVHTETTPAILFYYFAVALAASLAPAITHWQPAPWHIWFTLLAIGVGLSLAMSLYTATFRYAKPSAVGPIAYFGVVFSGLWGWLFWGQIPTMWTFAGIGLVVFSALITLRTGAEDQPVSEGGS